MTVSAVHIRTAIDGYLLSCPDQTDHLAPVLSLLERGVDPSDRSQWAGQVTASAVVFNPDGRILLVHHRKHDKYLQPDEHLEAVDETLTGAALREIGEVTSVRDVEPSMGGPIHISVHPVPARPRSGEQAHFHFDVRFVFTTVSGIGALRREVVRDAAWMATADLTDPSLRETVAFMAKVAS